MYNPTYPIKNSTYGGSRKKFNILGVGMFRLVTIWRGQMRQFPTKRQPKEMYPVTRTVEPNPSMGKRLLVKWISKVMDEVMAASAHFRTG